MTGATKALAAYVARVKGEGMPPDVVIRAKQLVIDFVGSVVRAGREADSTPSIFGMLKALGLDGPGDARVFGLERGYNPATAALLNGAFGHSLDFDDTHASSSLHPSAPVVPAALAAAELTNASGHDMLTAIIAGYEVCCRLGLALDPTAHYARGFHPTATAGVFGAAAAAAVLYGLGSEKVESAFGVAASQAAGSLQFLENGSWNKRYQVGAAAMNGLIAATLAREGFVGSRDAIDGKHGFLTGYSDKSDASKVVADLGHVYETMKIGVKPYPSCRYTHAALDAIIALRDEYQLRPDDFQDVRIGLHANGITLTGSPIAQKRRPQSVVDGQFSMPFTAAVAIRRGAFGWDDYALLADPGVLAIATRIDVVRDERLEGKAHPFGASISIRTPRGTVERLTPDPSGEPESFPSEGATHGKFQALAAPVLGDRTSGLLQKLANLDTLETVHDLFL